MLLEGWDELLKCKWQNKGIEDFGEFDNPQSHLKFELETMFILNHWEY